jgi:hypothetical protein
MSKVLLASCFNGFHGRSYRCTSESTAAEMPWPTYPTTIHGRPWSIVLLASGRGAVEFRLSYL